MHCQRRGSWMASLRPYMKTLRTVSSLSGMWEYGILYVMQHTLWIKCFPELGYVNEPKDVNVGVNDLLDFGEYFGEQ